MAARLLPSAGQRLRPVESIVGEGERLMEGLKEREKEESWEKERRKEVKKGREWRCGGG